MTRPRGAARAAPLVAVLAVLALLAGCAGPPADRRTGTPRPSASHPETPRAAFDGVPLVPESGVYLGAYVGDGSLAATDRRIGRTPQIHLTYVGWEDAWSVDPVLAADRARGQLSLVNWEPFGADFHDIVAGRYDDLLAARGEEAAALPDPVLLDLAAEMNEEEGWGDHDPPLYIAGYRHIHDVVASRADGKVVWVWAPNTTDSPDAPAALEYYPGDAYVDWTGIDGYNWGTSHPGFAWQSFASVFRDRYDDLHGLGKPIIIGETASAETGGSKAAWIRGIVPTLERDFPDIRAVVWFDVRKERDWRIRSSSDARGAFRDLAADPLFQATAP